MKLSKKVDHASLDIVGRNRGCVCRKRYRWHLRGLVQASQIAPASSQSHLKFQLIHAWFALVRLAIAIYGVNLGGKCKM